MRVKEIMNKAIAVDDDISIKQAARIMSNKNIGSLIVMNGKKIAGILTERDILKNLDRGLDGKIDKIISRNVIYIEPDDTLDDAAKIMAQKKIKRLPVLEKNMLIGMITMTDLIAHSDELNEEFLLD
jgi:CBS domain-containing protein